MRQSGVNVVGRAPPRITALPELWNVIRYGSVRAESELWSLPERLSSYGVVPFTVGQHDGCQRQRGGTRE